MYKSDIEIAQSVPMKPIQEIAASWGWMMRAMNFMANTSARWL